MDEQEPRPFKFSLKRKETPVELEGEDGVARTFYIRELSGADRDKFLNLMASKLKSGPDGKPMGIKDFTGLYSDLLSLSIYDAQGQRVSPGTIQTWPASVQNELFKEAQRVSGLDIKTAEEAAKND